MQRLSARLEQLRQERGWSKVELAKRAGLHYQHVCKILRGQRQQIDICTLAAFARCFEVSTDSLLGLAPVKTRERPRARGPAAALRPG